MRTVVTIIKRGKGYVGTVCGKFGAGFQGLRCGLEPYQAAAKALEWMVSYSQSNDEGGDLIAPKEVLDLVPKNLHSILAKSEINIDKEYPYTYLVAFVSAGGYDNLIYRKKEKITNPGDIELLISEICSKTGAKPIIINYILMED